MISLPQESIIILERMQKDDLNFNFSKFVQNALKGDNSFLTLKEVLLKIKVAETEIKNRQEDIKRLKDAIPIIEQKQKDTDLIKRGMIENSIKTLKRVLKEDGNIRFLKVLPIHSEMTGVYTDELEERVKNINEDEGFK